MQESRSELAEAVLDIDNVTKTYDDLVAVDHVSLRLEQGQTLGLIGPNGAGKTTLLRIICSLAQPDHGDVRILGHSVRENPRQIRRLIGFMPAEFGYPRNLSIGEYLDYFGCMYGIPRDVRAGRVRDVCELTDLLGREQVLVKGLSTGNRQRLLLAKTLLHDPEVLVLDEPASGLDPRARTELRGTVKALAAMGKTIIISSHILPDIEDISDHIGILEAGRLIVDGNISALRGHYENKSQRALRLRVPIEESARAKAILEQLDGVASCERCDPFLVVHCTSVDGNTILAAMLQHEIRIVQFADDGPNLEEIFMRSTAGKVT